jgi:hypothetical protein
VSYILDRKFGSVLRLAGDLGERVIAVVELALGLLL